MEYPCRVLLDFPSRSYLDFLSKKGPLKLPTKGLKKIDQHTMYVESKDDNRLSLLLKELAVGID